jgi:hypothetical protein
MNPIEVQMLSRLSPTGQLTVNPMTGQKEAFLPFLAPLLGSFLGNAALGSTLTAALGSKALGAAAAGAIGSGLATTAATGDLEQGIMSGITGFGIGSALGGLGELAKTGTDIAKAAPTVADTASTVATAAPDLSTVAPAVGEGFGASVGPIADTAVAAAPTAAEVLPEIGEGFTAGAGSTGTVAGRVLPEPPTFGERLIDPLRRPGDLFKQLAEPSSFLPIYVGETGRVAREQELMGRGSAKAFEEEQAAERRRTLAQMGNVFNQVRQAYPGVGYAQGGQIDRYAIGGGVENAIRQAAERAGYDGEYGNFSGSLPYDIPDAKNVQLSLRGAEYVPPPAASYAALDLGGEGYLPGVAGEFQYFREPPAPPVAVDPGSLPGGGNIAGGTGGYFGGDFNIEDLINLRNAGRDFNVQPMADDRVTLPQTIDFSSLYGGIGAIRMPENMQPPRMEVLPDDQQIYASRELLVPVADQENYLNEFMMDERAGGGMLRYQEGGMTDPAMQQNDQSIVAMTVAAIRGEVENADEVISQFLDLYGPEAFMELRNAVLQDIVPGAQTEGMVSGQGGGQDDMVEGMIGTQRPVAVSPGEYIIPADAVALAGGGYSGDGAKFFDGLVDDIRQKTMGTTQQVKPYR